MIGILCSDLHLSHAAPKSRKEKGGEWYKVMGNYLDQVRSLRDEHHAPIFIAGDIFHTWEEPPELVNFVINKFHKMGSPTTIPGQHDLPNHNYGEIKRSAYWTLVEAGAIRHLEVGEWAIIGDVEVRGFAWGQKIRPIDAPHRGSDQRKLALVHAYVWNTKRDSYPGAPEEKLADAYAGQLTGYHAAAFGDNHVGFIRKLRNGCTLFNCGGFIKRKSDEFMYTPQVGLLMSTGRVIPHHLDDSDDEFDLTHKEDAVGPAKLDPELIKAVNAVGDRAENFAELLFRVMDDKKVRAGVRDVITAAIGRHK